MWLHWCGYCFRDQCLNSQEQIVISVYQVYQLNQLSSSGVSTSEIVQCFDNINGHGIFVIGHLLEPKVVLNNRFNDEYTLDLLRMDFGGESVKLDTNYIALFDSGSDRLYTPELVFNDLAEKFSNLLVRKNATKEVQLGPSNCFKLIGRDLTYELVDEEFPSMSLYFLKEQVLKISPRNYIRPSEDEKFKDYWCLYVDKFQLKYDDTDVFILGGSVVSQKIVLYDNLNRKVGFADHDCSKPIQLEGGDGKPISITSN